MTGNQAIKSWCFCNFSTTEILANVVSEIDDQKGRRYFEGSLKFQATLNRILEMCLSRVRLLAEDDINGANISQMWGVVLLLFVMILSPCLVILAKNAINSIQVFAGDVDSTYYLYLNVINNFGVF